MSSVRTRVADTLTGEATGPFPHGPHAVYVTATLAGVSIEEYTLKPDVMADCLCRFVERFKPDVIWVSADTWVTAEAMGAEVAFPGGGQPLSGTGRPLVQSPADLDRIPPPAPHSQGRMPGMLSVIRTIRKRLGEDIFIAGCFDQSPFSLACALGGMNEIMLNTLTDRPMVEMLMQHGETYATAYGRAMAEAGADLLSTGDSPAGLLGPDLYRELALPAEQRVFAALKDTGVPCSLHICGEATALLPAMSRSGAQVLEIDQRVDLAQACALVPEHIALWGNIDPVLLERGTAEDIRTITLSAEQTVRQAGRTRFVLSSGCTLAPNTPPEAIEALLARSSPPPTGT